MRAARGINQSLHPRAAQRNRPTPRKGSTSLTPFLTARLGPWPWAHLCVYSIVHPAYAQDVQNTEYEPTKTTANAANAPATPAIRTAADRERSVDQAISPAKGRATTA
jgi:hypothetical protein